MLKIAFHTNQLGERGTEIALYDYAIYNRSLLKNRSVILYNQNSPNNNAKVIEKFQKEFDVYPYADPAEIEGILKKNAYDLMYAIKSGKNDGIVSKAVPTMVHAVFPTSPTKIHGASYAFVSKWLAEFSTKSRVPYVPHIVGIAQTDGDLRTALGIPQNATVFGCYGGNISFDIRFVKTKVIPKVLNARDDVYFIFMNIAKFTDDPRVIFLPGSADEIHKARFVNSCDAMLHARRLGETFGLACGEFSLAKKPVITFSGSPQKEHIRILGSDALLYHNARSLFKILMAFDRTKNHRTAYNTYANVFSPEAVMKSFEKHLIAPALEADINANECGPVFGRLEIASFYFRNIAAKIRKYMIIRKRR